MKTHRAVWFASVFSMCVVTLTWFGAVAQAQQAATLDIGTARDIYDGSLFPDKAVRTYSHTDKLFPTRTIKAGKQPSPMLNSDKPLTAVAFASNGKTYDLPDYVALNRVVGLLVLKDGYISSIDDPVTKYLPQLAGSTYQQVSVRNILTMSSGVKWNETYVDPASDRRKYLECQIASDKPGAIFEIMKALPKAAEPGTRFNYSTGETVLLGEILQAATKMHLADYLSQKIWEPLGMEADGAWYLDAPGGHEVGGSGVLARLRDFGRFGQFVLNGAKFNGQAIVPDGWLADATSGKINPRDAGYLYGYQWWVVDAKPGSPNEGAFMGRGIHGQSLYVNPNEKVVVVVLSARPKPTGKDAIADLDFLSAVVEKLRNQ